MGASSPKSIPAVIEVIESLGSETLVYTQSGDLSFVVRVPAASHMRSAKKLFLSMNEEKFISSTFRRGVLPLRIRVLPGFLLCAFFALFLCASCGDNEENKHRRVLQLWIMPNSQDPILICR